MSDYDYQENEVPQGRARGVRPLGALDRKRKLDEAVRLTADAVVQAAREWKAAWHNQRYYPREYEKARETLADAVAAHDKALAEQRAQNTSGHKEAN